MFKECSFVLLIFLVILAISSAVYSRTNNSANAQTVSLLPSSQEVTPFKKWYDEQKEEMQHPSNAVGIKITAPATGQKVPVGELKVSGTSTDNSTTDCRVYVDLNDIKPMQNTTAVGPAGQNDYSNWTFTYTNRYHLISEEVNELTSKLSCINNPATITKYYSVNVTGVDTSLAAANNTTKNETQQAMEQQPITDQQVPQSPADQQQQEEKRRINQVKEQHSNGDNMPSVLPFDSHNSTDYWIISETVK
jgi:hypothetical protein